MQSSNFGGFFTKDYGHTPGWNLMKIWYAIESDLYLWCSLSLKKTNLSINDILFQYFMPGTLPGGVLSFPSTLPPWDRGYPWTKKNCTSSPFKRNCYNYWFFFVVVQIKRQLEILILHILNVYCSDVKFLQALQYSITYFNFNKAGSISLNGSESLRWI